MLLNRLIEVNSMIDFLYVSTLKGCWDELQYGCSDLNKMDIKKITNVSKSIDTKELKFLLNRKKKRLMIVQE